MMLTSCAVILLLLTSGQEVTGDVHALVQTKVLIHDSSADAARAGVAPKVAKAHFLLDNSILQFNGPGVLYRRTQNINDIVDNKAFMAWGTIFEAYPVDPNWVKYHDYYLPTSLRGSKILTLQAEPEAAKLPKPVRFHYGRTEIIMSDGKQVPARIWGMGKKPNTFNVEVKPEHFAHYNITDVPRSSLTRLKEIRDYDVVPPPPKEIPTNLMRAELGVDPTIHFNVIATNGETMQVKMFRKSPLRAMMKMACEKAAVTYFRCLKIKFMWDNTRLHPENSTNDFNMTDDLTIKMVS